MKTIRANAEYQLKDDLEAARNSGHENWRGLLFRLSALQAQGARKELERVVFSLMTDHAAEKDGGLYFCADGDIVATIRPASDEDCARISSELMKFAPPDMPADVGLVRLYHISPTDVGLDMVCAEKVRALRTAAANPLKVAETKELKMPQMSSALFAKVIEMRGKRNKPCILLVEDDPASLFLAKRALWQDFEVITASSGSEALAAYTASAPDLVFLDIGLPDTTGHRVLEKIVYLDPQASVVMLSGNSFRDEIVKAMKQGAKGFVGKPFSRAKLLHYINQLVPTAAHVDMA